MENIKVLVESIDEYNEAKNLVYELNCDDWVICQDSKGKGTKDFIESKFKRISLAQLRDMVVLKRNNVGDATHEYSKGFGDNFKYRKFDDEWYFFGCDGWDKSNNSDHDKLKLIQDSDLPFIDSEKDVKEYLEPMPNGDYRYHIDDGFSIGGDWIEIPEGAEVYSVIGLNHFTFSFYRNNFSEYCNSSTNMEWRSSICELSESRGFKVLWQRNPQKESLNDKVASAEVARQKQPNQKTIDAMRESEDIINKKHSHYKKDVSHLDFIDVYRVLNLFEVESHAVGHAVKKLLCSGQRGAKDKAQDIQEAIDSLNRELEMMRENDNS